MDFVYGVFLFMMVGFVFFAYAFWFYKSVFFCDVWESAKKIIVGYSFVIALASVCTGFVGLNLICSEYIYDAWYVKFPVLGVMGMVSSALVFYVSILPNLVMFAVIHIAKNTPEK